MEEGIGTCCSSIVTSRRFHHVPFIRYILVGLFNTLELLSIGSVAIEIRRMMYISLGGHDLSPLTLAT